MRRKRRRRIRRRRRMKGGSIIEERGAKERRRGIVYPARESRTRQPPRQVGKHSRQHCCTTPTMNEEKEEKEEKGEKDIQCSNRNEGRRDKCRRSWKCKWWRGGQGTRSPKQWQYLRRAGDEAERREEGYREKRKVIEA